MGRRQGELKRETVPHFCNWQHNYGGLNMYKLKSIRYGIKSNFEARVDFFLAQEDQSGPGPTLTGY